MPNCSKHHDPVMTGDGLRNATRSLNLLEEVTGTICRRIYYWGAIGALVVIGWTVSVIWCYRTFSF